jgi:hypothetical protein
VVPNSESSPSKCGWTGPLPEFKKPTPCQACQRLRTAGEVVRCKRYGVDSQATVSRSEHKADRKPCLSLGAIVHHEPCGCGGRKLIPVHQCEYDWGRRRKCVPAEIDSIKDSASLIDCQACEKWTTQEPQDAVQSLPFAESVPENASPNTPEL